jgi:hypothetical protein
VGILLHHLGILDKVHLIEMEFELNQQLISIAVNQFAPLAKTTEVHLEVPPHRQINTLLSFNDPFQTSPDQIPRNSSPSHLKSLQCGLPL